MSTVFNRVAWHEIGTHDIDATHAFYTTLFGWNKHRPSTKDSAAPFPILPPDLSVPQGTVVGQPGHVAEYAVFSIMVEDLDRTIAVAQTVGGSVEAPPVGNPFMRFARLRDTRGNVLGVFETDYPPTQPVEPVFAPGSICMLEIGSTDPLATRDFYNTVFGWNFSSSRSVGTGPYSVITAAGADLPSGHLYESGPTGFDYASFCVMVKDSTTAAVAARKLGGTVERAPVRTPEGHTCALLADHRGNRFGIITPAPHFPEFVSSATNGLTIEETYAAG